MRLAVSPIKYDCLSLFIEAVYSFLFEKKWRPEAIPVFILDDSRHKVDSD